MKKRAIFLCALCMGAGMLLPGCKESTEDAAGEPFLFCADAVKYHMEGSSDFAFNVTFLSHKEDVPVEFVRFIGKNTEGLQATCNDDTYDNLKNFKREGYYIKLLGFACKTADEEVQIDAVELKIDGKEQQFAFQTPIRHAIFNESELSDAPVLAGSHPTVVMTNSFDVNQYKFQYLVEGDVTLDGFFVNDFLGVKDATVFVDGAECGTLDSLPIAVSKGAQVQISGHFEILDTDAAAAYDNIYCVPYLSYTTQTGKQLTATSQLVCQGVSNEEDAEKSIALAVQDANEKLQSDKNGAS